PPEAVAAPWLPQPPEWKNRTAEAQADDRHSMLSLYRAALRIRRGEPALRTGRMAWLAAPDGVLAFTRGARFACVAHLSSRPTTYPCPPGRPRRGDRRDGRRGRRDPRPERRVHRSGGDHGTLAVRGTRRLRRVRAVHGVRGREGRDQRQGHRPGHHRRLDRLR